MPEPTCIEERAAVALIDARNKLFDAQHALEDWRNLYFQRHFVSRRSGDQESSRLANDCYVKINKLVNRCITVIGKVEDIQTLLSQTDLEINGKED